MRTNFTPLPSSPASPRAGRGFSLIEILVVTGLLSVIILGLVLMFGQTQRAYRLGMTQVDVLEGGRLVTEMMTREVAQISPTHQIITNCVVILRDNVAPLYQDLPGNVSTSRTNLLMDFYFLTKENQTWSGVGYTVLDPETGGVPAGGVGTLYRYSSNAFYGQNLAQIYNGFLFAPATNMSRILDGVVYFKVRTFDTRGDWIDRTRSLNISNSPMSGAIAGYPFGETQFLAFQSNAVPASVEIELGVLEERTAERARSISSASARANFLAKEAGKVHIFRWRVPVRNVDPTAYQ